MGYAYLSNGKKQGYKILIDEAMDISAVPGEKFFPGTEAVTADGATRFRLNNAHEWVEVTGDTPGGGWPEDLPLPSEGGYGYVEGELTTIEWDGDTEGKTKAQDVPDTVGCDFYKVSDIVVANKETIIGGVFFADSGISVPITDDTIGVQEGVISVADYLVFVSEENVESTIGTFPETGVYFGKTNSFYVSKVQYGNGTIHKVDSKYLPEVGNDTFKVTFSDAPVPGTVPPEFTADKSAAEMMAATGSGKLLFANTGNGVMPIYFDPISGLQCISTTYRLDGGGSGELHIFGYEFDMSSETWKYFTDVISVPD